MILCKNLNDFCIEPFIFVLQWAGTSQNKGVGLPLTTVDWVNNNNNKLQLYGAFQTQGRLDHCV